MVRYRDIPSGTGGDDGTDSNISKYEQRQRLPDGVEEAPENGWEAGEVERPSLLVADADTDYPRLLVKKVIEAQEAERRRIARDIHDETQQLLGNAIFRLDLCLQQRPDAPQPLRKDLLRIREILTDSVRGLQDLSQSLRPSLLDDLGLRASLAWFFRTYGVKDRVNLRWNITGLVGRLASEVEMALFRIVQEACNNVLKHARAKNLRIGIRVNHTHAIVVVSDDGVGFDVEGVKARRGAEGHSIPIGLAGMRERAELLGGKLFLQSRPGMGTRVAAVIPLRASYGNFNNRDSNVGGGDEEVKGFGGADYGRSEHVSGRGKRKWSEGYDNREDTGAGGGRPPTGKGRVALVAGQGRRY